MVCVGCLIAACLFFGFMMSSGSRPNFLTDPMGYKDKVREQDFGEVLKLIGILGFWGTVLYLVLVR